MVTPFIQKKRKIIISDGTRKHRQMSIVEVVGRRIQNSIQTYQLGLIRFLDLKFLM
jgi:hypothetical protein